MIEEEFEPNRDEVRRQCASCPFRLGNEVAFAAFLDGVDLVQNRSPAEVTAHYRGVSESCTVDGQGNFACHSTVYTANGKERPLHTWKQCKGATAYYRERLKEVRAKTR